MLRVLLLVCLVGLSPPLLAEVVVEDDAGRTVRLSRTAERIVSLAPHLTEQLFAIGAGNKIVGAVDYSDYPEEAKAIPRVGGYSRLDLERILALEPDLVVGWESGNDVRQLERLQALGITVYFSEPRRLNDIAESMARLGILSGAEDAAELAAERFRHGIARLRDAHRHVSRLRVFYQIWNRPLMTVSGGHLINDVITLCGGDNIFSDINALTPTVSEEAVIAADPQVIIAGGMGAERPEWLDEWRRWSQLAAVRHGRMHTIKPDIIQRATPRLLQGAERFCMLLDAARQALPRGGLPIRP